MLNENDENHFFLISSYAKNLNKFLSLTITNQMHFNYFFFDCGNNLCTGGNVVIWKFQPIQELMWKLDEIMRNNKNGK